MEYHGNAYNSIPAQRKVENYESYHKRDSLNVYTQPATNHPQPVTRYELWGCKSTRLVYDLATSELRAVKCLNLSKMDKDSVEGCLQEICLLDKAPYIVHMYNL